MRPAAAPAGRVDLRGRAVAAGDLAGADDGDVTLGVLALAIDQGWHWQTMVFTTLALLQLGHALAIRSERWSLFQLGWRSNRSLSLTVVGHRRWCSSPSCTCPFLQPVFETQALGAPELLVVLAASSVAFLAVEAEKWLRRRRLATEMRPNRNLPVG